MIKCAILGATGYTGIELAKILLRHPYVRLTHLTTRQNKPIPLKTLIPTLEEADDYQIKNYSLDQIKKSIDVAFVCLPHTEAMKSVAKLRRAGKTVIDLSADYRLKKTSDYPKWYGVKHLYPKLLKEAVYGLPEFFKKKIEKADLIANPGCYPTGANLGMAPLVQAGLVSATGIVVDSKSGVSGAGKKANTATLYAELTENFYAYKVNKHQHTPEILQTLNQISKKKCGFTFVPHLLPLQRGILSVIYMDGKKTLTAAKVAACFKKAYENEPFVRVKKENEFPALRDVQGTNYCDIGFTLDKKTKRVIVITAIDNLVKGASGQAIQNMNIRFGFPEEAGLI